MFKALVEFVAEVLVTFVGVSLAPDSLESLNSFVYCGGRNNDLMQEIDSFFKLKESGKLRMTNLSFHQKEPKKKST